jgi:hypothetical protein
MKYCAARIASAGGRCAISPLRLSAAVAIIGPRIDAPNSPSRAAAHQPAPPASAISAISTSGTSRAGSPGALLNGTPQTPVISKGASDTITSTRVAWISDSVRRLPPASRPKTSMSCSPPGIAAK